MKRVSETKKKNKPGFTLLEILVVISIIGVLAAVVLVAMRDSRDKAFNARIEQTALQIITGLSLYYASHSSYPYDPATTYPGYIIGEAPATCSSYGFSADLERSTLFDSQIAEVLPGFIGLPDTYITAFGNTTPACFGYYCNQISGGKCLRVSLTYFLKRQGQTCLSGFTAVNQNWIENATECYATPHPTLKSGL